MTTKKDNKRYNGSFKQTCDLAGVDYERARAYRRIHKVSDEEAIQYCIERNLVKMSAEEKEAKQQELKAKQKEKEELEKERAKLIKLCNLHGADYNVAIRIKNKNKLMSNVEIVDYCLKNKKLMILRDKCKEYNLDYKNASLYWTRNNRLSLNEVVTNLVNNKNNDRDRIFKELKLLCEKNNIDYSNAYMYKYNHWELTNEQVIEYYKSRTKSISKLCDEAGVKYTSVMSYKEKNPDIEIEEIIKYYQNLNKDSFKDKCNKAGVVYKTAVSYRRNTPGITDEQVIQHFNPYCYYNIRGEFIIVPIRK